MTDLNALADRVIARSAIHKYGAAKTPALALPAAILRARAEGGA